jgi:hypothetical protein
MRSIEAFSISPSRGSSSRSMPPTRSFSRPRDQLANGVGKPIFFRSTIAFGR